MARFCADNEDDLVKSFIKQSKCRPYVLGQYFDIHFTKWR